MNITPTHARCWLGLSLLTSLAGCAATYQSYSCGCVPYGYCPDRPLPYRTYSGCPTPIASVYAPKQTPQPFPPPLPAE